jgi:hypothetical protein
MPDTIDCDLPMVVPTNDPCLSGATPLGKQVTGILMQDARGVAPTLTTLANVQAALTAAGNDQLFILPNISDGIVPDATDETLTGNAVPFGGTIVTGRTRTMTGRLVYLDPAGVAAADSFNARQKPVRYWEYDDNERLQGPFENATVSLGVLTRAGIGNAALPGKSLIASTRLPGLVEPPIATGRIVGINALRNV